MRRQKTRKAKGEVGPRVVRAWFDTVVNPVVHRLKYEYTLLMARNWTWSWQHENFEELRPIASQLDPVVRDNLEHLMELYPRIRAYVKDHDDNLAGLLEDCRLLHRAIQRSPELLELYNVTVSEQALADLDKTRIEIFGAYPQSEHLDLLAQYIVNGEADLPLYYSTAPLWNKHKDRFLAIRETPSIRAHYEATIKQGDSLRASVEKPFTSLTDLRRELSLKHDVPYVTGLIQAT